MNTKTVAAIAGCGIVGSAVAVKLIKNRTYYKEKTGCDIELRYIFDRTFTKAEEVGLPKGLFRTDLSEIIADGDVDIIIELVGGTVFSKEVVEKALKAGKHVVTANKALLATHGPELMALARESGATISFEASCGGGIPIIRALQDGLLANRIEALYGIVNGTCNYILSSMISSGQSYKEALASAQEKGFAEADPTFDVTGIDSAHKLTILSSLAFSVRTNLDSIPVSGIDTLSTMDVVYGKELGYVVKLLAVARKMEEGLSLRVRPVFISTCHPLAWVSGPFNAVSVYGDTVGHTMYYGRGAGGNPTASAVIADIFSAALGTSSAIFSNLKIWPDRNESIPILPMEKIYGRYYIRSMVMDKPGVFAGLASALGNHGVSISSALQKEPPETDGTEKPVPIIITTHSVQEGALLKAIEEIKQLECVTQSPVCIEIMDEFEETFN